MDNASKALIFAGGILIAVLVISVAIYVLSMARGVAKTSNERLEANAVQSYNRFYESFGASGVNIKGIDALNIYRKATDDNQKDTILHRIQSVSAPSSITSLSNAIDSGSGTGTGAECLDDSFTLKYTKDVDGYIYTITIQ